MARLYREHILGEKKWKGLFRWMVCCPRRQSRLWNRSRKKSERWAISHLHNFKTQRPLDESPAAFLRYLADTLR